MQGDDSLTSVIEYDDGIAYMGMKERDRCMDYLIDSNYYYVIYPSKEGLYCVRTVPETKSTTTMKNMRLPFPPAWRKATPKELQRMTHVSDLVFCDNDGETCMALTLEGAVKAARLSLNGSQHDCSQCPWACPQVCW